MDWYLHDALAEISLWKMCQFFYHILNYQMKQIFGYVHL